MFDTLRSIFIYPQFALAIGGSAIALYLFLRQFKVVRRIRRALRISKTGKLPLPEVEEWLDVAILRLHIELPEPLQLREIALRDTIKDREDDFIERFGVSEIVKYSNSVHLIIARIIHEELSYKPLSTPDKEVVIYDTSILIKIDFDNRLVDYYCNMPIDKQAEHLIQELCRHSHEVLTGLMTPVASTILVNRTRTP